MSCSGRCSAASMLCTKWRPRAPPAAPPSGRWSSLIAASFLSEESPSIAAWLREEVGSGSVIGFL